MSLSYTLMFLGAILGLFVITFLWGLLRGLAKTRIRSIMLIGCAVAAVISTIALKNYIASESIVNDVILPVASAFNVGGDQLNMISSLLGVSHTMNEVLLGSIGALIAPMLCVAFFLTYSIITWIVFAIVSLFCSASMKRHNARSRFKPVRILIWALAQTLVVVAIYMIPVSVYSEAVTTVLDELTDANMLSDSTDDVEILVNDVLMPVNEDPVIVTFRVMGGRPLCNLITDFEANGVTTHLNDEVGAVTDFSCNVYRLTRSKLKDMSEKEAEIMKDIADSVEDSALLSTIASEVVYTATNNWKADETFLGVKKPRADDIFTPLLDSTVDVFHQDSKSITALRADFYTLADLVTCLSSYDILSDLSDTDALIEKMNGGNAINEMTAILNANHSMKVLIPEVTNMGVRAIASSLGLSPEETKLHEEFMGNMANSLNDVKGMEREEQKVEINNRLEAEFVKSGITVEREKIEAYSGSMIDNLLDKQEAGEEITEEDMQAFFITYALDEIQKQKEAGNEDFKDIEIPGVAS